MTEIQPALPNDAAAVTSCVRSAYAGYVERIGREPAPMAADNAALIARGEVWVVCEAGRLVGVLVMRPDPPALFVENVAVLPEQQGRGVGRALMAFAEDHARAAGLAEVALYTNQKDDREPGLLRRPGLRRDRPSQRGRLRARVSPQSAHVIADVSAASRAIATKSSAR
jgi:ribosomal protein S18 acetylase RimI-like enzyme